MNARTESQQASSQWRNFSVIRRRLLFRQWRVTPSALRSLSYGGQVGPTRPTRLLGYNGVDAFQVSG